MTVLIAMAYAVVAVWRMPPPAGLVFQKVREGDHAMLAAYLRDEPGLVGWRDSLGLTPLHWAASTNDAAAARQLLRAGADPNARDDRGQTPLHVAAISQNRHRGDAVMKLLIESGADVNAADQKGVSPLELSRRMEREDLAQTLLAAGATPPAAVPDAQGDRLAVAAGGRRIGPPRPMFARRWAVRAMGARRPWLRFEPGRPPRIRDEHPAS